MLLLNENDNSEVHVKIGGEHGGGSFKVSYQIANVANANSKDNTLVFSFLRPKTIELTCKLVCQDLFSKLMNYRV